MKVDGSLRDVLDGFGWWRWRLPFGLMMSSNVEGSGAGAFFFAMERKNVGVVMMMEEWTFWVFFQKVMQMVSWWWWKTFALFFVCVSRTRKIIYFKRVSKWVLGVEKKNQNICAWERERDKEKERAVRKKRRERKKQWPCVFSPMVPSLINFTNKKRQSDWSSNQHFN